MTNYYCVICDENTTTPKAEDLGNVNGNTSRFLNTTFNLWRCPRCTTIHSLEPVNFSDIYSDYPLNKQRQLDFYAQSTLKNLLSRCVPHGLTLNSSILDYGCGNGVFIQFLKKNGYTNVSGFDPYLPQYQHLDNKKFDLVVLNDVIEHVEDPSALLDTVIPLVKSNGLFYVGTADSEGVKSMKDLEQHRTRLHQPFHRKIINQKTLLDLGIKKGLIPLQTFRRSYMDTLLPLCNYRFLDEFNQALGNNMDLALDPKSSSIVLKKPWLLFYAFFGYFLPSAIEPAVIWRLQK